MSIQITLTPEEERKLAELARARGKDRPPTAHEVVAAYLNGADQRGTKSFEGDPRPDLGGAAPERHDRRRDRRPHGPRASRGPERAAAVERDAVSHDGPPRAVFDCMVFFQATARPTGPAARSVHRVRRGGRLALYISDVIVEEVRDLLGRTRIRARIRPLPTNPSRSSSTGFGRSPRGSTLFPPYLPWPATLTTSPISISPLPPRRIIWSPATTTCST